MFKTIQKMKVREDRGFTLIELLIVVAIIGILAAIAIPAFLGQQKKAKWRALQSSCDGASKQVSVFLSDLNRLDPIVLLSDAKKRVCYANFSRTRVDTGADGSPDTNTCEAKFREITTAQGIYSTATAATVVQELAQGLVAEACGASTGNLAAAGATLLSESFDAVAPFGGLMKTSPYSETKCLYNVKDDAGAGYAVAETEEGQCVLAYNEGAKTLRLVAIEDDGKAGTWGETKVWVAVAE